jgi:FkbM family methyltransferase
MRTAKITESLETLRGCGLPVGCVVDVGIQHATPPLMTVFPDLHHYLFEPVEEYYAAIEKNYQAIGHTLVRAAVSDRSGEIILHTAKKTRGEEISHSWISASTTSSSRTVRATSLDDYFSGTDAPAPLLLKIDVEGPQVPSMILRGAASVLARSSAVVIEMTVDTFMERATLVHAAGFDLWDLCDLCYYGDCLWQADAVFVRRSCKKELPRLAPMHSTPYDARLWQSGF